MMKPIERKDLRLVNEVASHIRDAIRTGAYPAGYRLHQERLAEELGVSRTPVREALLKLEQENLIVVRPGRGRFVRGVTFAELAQLTEVRVILEPVAARLATERASESERRELDDMQRYQESLDIGSLQPLELMELSLKFHRQLTAPCGNDLIKDTLRTISTHGENIDHFMHQIPGQDAGGALVLEHRAIVDAFLANDGESVERLVRSHISGWSSEDSKQSEVPSSAEPESHALD